MLFFKTFLEYHEALKVFEHKKDEYSTYVKSQSRDLDDINLYKENINYRIIDPDCCSNCAFCDRHHGVMTCLNRKNFVFADFTE